MFKKTLALVVPFLGYSMESSYQLHHQSLNDMLKDLSPIQIQNNTDHPVRIELFFDKTLNF